MGKLLNTDIIPMVKVNKQTLGWLRYDDVEGKIPVELAERLYEGADQEDNWASYDCHDDYDIFYLAIPEELKDVNSLPHLYAVISKDEVLIIYSQWSGAKVDKIPTLLKYAVTKKASVQRAVLAVVDHITKNDGMFLAKIEDSVTSLEEEIMQAKDSDLKDKHTVISEFRRKIQPMHQMYEQLMDALEDLMEDEKELYNETDKKYATRLHNRVERLYKTVINLRDYISQVREAYQTQLDIGLNNVMKTFTVIAAIFLPLTLLTSWYGMNFEAIHEFAWEYGYYAVMGGSALIIASCLILFKVKKWF